MKILYPQNKRRIGDWMRSRRYKKHRASDSLVGHDKAGWHMMCEYTLKGPFNPLEFYIFKNICWWYTVNRWIEVVSLDKTGWHKIRCAEKYEMFNKNHDY